MWGYRASLQTLIGILLLAIAGGILVVSRGVTSTAMRAQAQDQFREVSRRQVVTTQAHLRSALPALAALDAELRDGLDDEPVERIGRTMFNVFLANPGFSWISYGREDGSFVGVTRRYGKLVLNRSSIQNGKTAMYEHELLEDRSLREIRHEPDFGYDPRTRPFYVDAKRAGRRTWTQPYVFYDESVPGITCSMPHYRKDGSFAGVLTIDFDLNRLSGFMKSADLSENGTVILTTPSGTLVAHPSVSVVSTPGAGEQGTLLTISDLDDAAMKALSKAFGETHAAQELEGGLKFQQFRMRVEGAPYMGSFTAFPIDTEVSWFVAAIAPEDDFLGAARRKMFNAFVVLLLISIAVSLLGATALSVHFAKQIDAVTRQMDDVGRLDLADKPFPKASVREIAAMQTALTNMKGGLRSFARYVPRDLVRRLLLSGREAVLGGETREMTVFFSDIEGFTTIAESMTPAELVEMLREYLEEMTRIIAAHGGTVDKYLGDGILAFWGAPEPDPNHALRATQASLECAATLDELVSKGAFGGRKLRARIGLASGPVLVGNIGTAERMNYTVMGDTANLASRLEGLNKAYSTRLLVSEGTAGRLAGAVFARPVDVVAVKGKLHGVKVYEPIARITGKPALDADNIWLVETSTLALDEYLARDFAKAAATWSRILESRPSDGPAAAMREKADAFATAPPPPEWTGVTVAKEK